MKGGNAGGIRDRSHLLAAKIGIVSVAQREAVLLVLIEAVLKLHRQTIGRILRVLRPHPDTGAAVRIAGNGSVIELISRPSAVERIRRVTARGFHGLLQCERVLDARFQLACGVEHQVDARCIPDRADHLPRAAPLLQRHIALEARDLDRATNRILGADEFAGINGGSRETGRIEFIEREPAAPQDVEKNPRGIVR